MPFVISIWQVFRSLTAIHSIVLRLTNGFIPTEVPKVPQDLVPVKLLPNARS